MTSVENKLYQRHLFEYRFNGAEWGFEIAAESPAEAQERLKALAWAHYKGRVLATVPVPMMPNGAIGRFFRAILGRKMFGSSQGS